MTTTTRNESVFARVLGWLTAGYPQGIPATDRFAVVSLLKRRLTDREIYQIVESVAVNGTATDGVITDIEIEELTRRVLEETPSPQDLTRVSARLAAAGWPLEGTVG